MFLESDRYSFSLKGFLTQVLILKIYFDFQVQECLKWTNLLNSFLDILHGVSSDQCMKRFIFPWKHLSIFTPYLSLLYWAFTTNHDLSTALLLNVFQSVSTGGKKQNNRPMRSYFDVETQIEQIIINWELVHATHRGPIRSPTKLISGYSSWGIITLSLTRVAGGLRKI